MINIKLFMKKFLLATVITIQSIAVSAQIFSETFWTNGQCLFEATQKGDRIEFFGSAMLGDVGYDFTLIKRGRTTYSTEQGGSYTFGKYVEYRTIDDGYENQLDLLIAYDDKDEMTEVFYKFDGSIDDLLKNNFLKLLDGVYTDAAGKEYTFDGASVNGTPFEVMCDEYGYANNVKYKGKFYKFIFSDTGVNIYNARKVNGMVFGDVFTKTTIYKKLRKRTTNEPPHTGRWQYTSTDIVNVGMLSYFNDKAQLRIMRNEIFARRGYLFLSPDLKTKFSKMPWYHPGTDNSKIHFSDLENLNINIIKKYETAYPTDFYKKIEKGL